MSRFDRRLNPLSPVFLVVLMLAGIAVSGGRAAAEQDNLVRIRTTSNDLRITNRGRGTGICKSSKADCPNTITWEWHANPGDATKVFIDFKKGTSGAESCFKDSAGADQKTFVLTLAKRAVTATVDAGCPPKSAWIYEVRCEKSTGDKCDDPVDPGTIID